MENMMKLLRLSCVTVLLFAVQAKAGVDTMATEKYVDDSVTDATNALAKATLPNDFHSLTNNPAFTNAVAHVSSKVEVVAPTNRADYAGKAADAQLTGIALTNRYTKAETDGLLSEVYGSMSATNGAFAREAYGSLTNINVMTSNVVIGAGTKYGRSNTRQVVVGFAAETSASLATAVGGSAKATAYQSTALGYNARATAPRAVQIGDGENKVEDTLKFRDVMIVSNKAVVVGTVAPSATAAAGKAADARLTGIALSDRYTKAETDERIKSATNSNELVRGSVSDLAPDGGWDIGRRGIKLYSLTAEDVEISSINSIYSKADGNLKTYIDKKASKVTSATAGKLASLTADGDLEDSGIAKEIVATTNLVHSAVTNIDKKLAGKIGDGSVIQDGFVINDKDGANVLYLDREDGFPVLRTDAIVSSEGGLKVPSFNAIKDFDGNTLQTVIDDKVDREELDGKANLNGDENQGFSVLDLHAAGVEVTQFGITSVGDILTEGDVVGSRGTDYLSAKANKVAGATAGNLASLTFDGELEDSGIAKTNVATKDEILKLRKVGNTIYVEPEVETLYFGTDGAEVRFATGTDVLVWGKSLPLIIATVENDLAPKTMISATDQTFSNAVLSVATGISTNDWAVIASVADWASVIPGGVPTGAGSLGVVLAALAAAVLALKKKTSLLKSDGTAEDDFATDLLGKQVAIQKIDERLPIPIFAKNAGFTTESHKRFIVTVSDNMTVTLHTPTSGDAEIFECRFNGTSLSADASITFAGATATTMDANCGTVTAGKVALMSAFWNGTTWDVNWKVEG